MAVVILVAALFAPPAGAQSPDDLRTQAQAIEARLDGLRNDIELLVEQANQATAAADTATAQLALADGTLAALDRERALHREQLAEFAVRAYVDGGDLSRLDLLTSGDATEAGIRRSYLVLATGDQRDLIDGLRAASEDVERQRRRTADAKETAAARLSGVADARAEVERLMADEDQLLAATNGRLGVLVAEAEAARAAEEARAAEATRLQQLAAAPAVLAPSGTIEGSPDTEGSAGTDAPSSPTPSEASPVTSPPPPRPPVPAARPEAQRAVEAALSQVGVPYVYGGASPSQGFDCSGLIYWAYAQAGKSLSRPADYQRDDSIPITYEQLQPGDLIFYGEPVSHDAMYIGNDLIVNAPYTGEFVRVQSMWYSSKPMTYGRVP